MKKTLVAAALGLVGVVTTYGQGHVLISNYAVPPYNQVYWTSTGLAANNSQGVTLTIFYGLGTIVDPALLTGVGPSFGILTSGGSEVYDPGAGHGVGGYYLVPDFAINGWTAGTAVSFQIVASGAGINSALSRSPVWTEAGSVIAPVANPANTGTFSAGLGIVVPEPTTFALAGLGAAGMLIFRRRR